MTEIATPPVHRVSAAVTAARAAMAGAREVPVWSMTADQTKDTLAEIEAHEAQTAALKSRLLRHAESIDLPAENGARSAADWLARRHRLTRRETHRQRFLATALETHTHVESALGKGRVNLEQAHAILRGLQTLPEDLDPDLRVRAERHLVELAKEFDAKALKNLARTILEVVAPDLADQHLASKGPLGERKPNAERLGQAFMEYVQRYPTNKLPQAGGLNATIVCLIPLETLIGGLKAAKLDTGETISPALARQIACEAGIIPAVLGGNSEVLDLGRTRRFHNKAQRIVFTIEQGGYIEEGCDAPPAMTQTRRT